MRVHGRNYQDWFRAQAEPHERYDYLYPASELQPWAERVQDIAGQKATEDVYVVTNNHYRGKGVTNALMLQSMVEKKKVPAPSGIFPEYGEVLERYAVPHEPEAVEEKPQKRASRKKE